MSTRSLRNKTAQSSFTAATKHPHLSVVHLFKEPLHPVQRRSEIMNSQPTAVKPLPTQTSAHHRSHTPDEPTRLNPPQHHHQNRSADEEGAHYRHEKPRVKDSAQKQLQEGERTSLPT
jgi:hypothetical protein